MAWRGSFGRTFCSYMLGCLGLSHHFWECSRRVAARDALKNHYSTASKVGKIRAVEVGCMHGHGILKRMHGMTLKRTDFTFSVVPIRRLHNCKTCSATTRQNDAGPGRGTFTSSVAFCCTVLPRVPRLENLAELQPGQAYVTS